VSSNASLPSVQEIVQVVNKPTSLVDTTQVVLIEDTESNLFAQVVALFTTTFHGEVDPTAEQVKDYVKNGKYQLLALVDKEDKSLVGGAILGDLRGVHQEFVILEYFFVNPLKRGKGIGTSWFLILLDYVRQHTAYKVLVLECVKSLIGFYARLGAIDTCIHPSLCVRSLSATTAAAKTTSDRPDTLLSLMAVSLRDDGSEMSHKYKPLLSGIVAHIRKHLHRMITSVSHKSVSDQHVEPYTIWAQSH
jgi:GNAT superfamily N-acetyltransferase